MVQNNINNNINNEFFKDENNCKNFSFFIKINNKLSESIG